MRWAFLFPTISQNQMKPNPIFLLSILWSSIFSQVSCLPLLYFLWLWVSLIGDVEWWSWRPCVQVWANYRDSHQGWAAFWLQAQGIQSSWGSTQVKPVPLTSLCNEHTWEIEQASCLFDRYKKEKNTDFVEKCNHNSSMFQFAFEPTEFANSSTCWIIRRQLEYDTKIATLCCNSFCHVRTVLVCKFSIYTETVSIHESVMYMLWFIKLVPK